ncbi:hemolysin III family protein [Aquimarina sp. U1-2]|uniref:PAQR family membrane homeostasis protein TrhA n=1 Tax=Aquimarina sp. U1-2 TaxID=2823141 RepID=UPI001AECB3B3|nr:hemolysin III family protein [Aquimarina sp. U1-2]MBP2832817.1 hemolysin III family protein [Aquimarina sp. U1-2]
MQSQTPIEERWNWITHGLGLVLSIIGLFILLSKNSQLTQYSTLSIYMYSFSLMMLYFASTAYHYISNVKLKRKFRIWDHISIYFLIAGTYTPVSLVTLIHGKGWLLFFTVWAIAGIGTLLKLFFTGKYEFISLLLYVLMGWLIVLDLHNLKDKVGSEGTLMLLYGGAAYTFGILFYVMKRLKFHHAIWHVFVLAGSIFHYVFILNYVI